MWRLLGAASYHPFQFGAAPPALASIATYPALPGWAHVWLPALRASDQACTTRMATRHHCSTISCRDRSINRRCRIGLDKSSCREAPRAGGPNAKREPSPEGLGRLDQHLSAVGAAPL